MKRASIVAAAAVPAVLAVAAHQGDRYLRRRLAPARREMPHTPTSLGLEADDVWIESTVGTALHAWFIPPTTAPAPTVVVVHGWGANGSLMLEIAPVLHSAGWGVLVIDARGHGLSEAADHVSMPRFADDIESFLGWAGIQPEVDGLALLGHSVGAGAALLVASRRTDLLAVVGVGTFADPRELMSRAPAMQRLPATVRRGVFRRMELAMGAAFDEIVPLVTIGAVSAPVLLVHGDADEVVGIDDLTRLMAAAPEGASMLVVPDGTHDRFDEYLGLLPEVVGFLARAS